MQQPSLPYVTLQLQRGRLARYTVLLLADATADLFSQAFMHTC